MVNALVGKTSVTYVWIVPTEEGVEALRNSLMTMPTS